MPSGWNSLKHFLMLSNTSKVRKYMVADALSRRYALLSILDTKLLGFEYIKDLYAGDYNLCDMFNACEKWLLVSFISMKDFCFGKINYVCLCVFLHELCV